MQRLKGSTATGFTSPWARTWDQSNQSSGNPAVVKYINPTTAGVYDWSSFDLFFANNVGRRKIVTLGVPADWMITRAAIGGAGLGGKANMCPTGATELNSYVTAITDIVTRATVTHNSSGVAWELWNEIEGSGNYADSLPALGPYARAVSQAIKAVDPTAIILTPSARDEDTAYLVKNFLAASDGAGGNGGDWVDGIAMHVYMAQDPVTGNTPWAYKIIVDTYRRGAIDSGYPSLPIYCTESGSLLELDDLAEYLQRRLLVFAGLGVQAFIGYASDFPDAPLAPYVSEWNATVAAISGKTISSMVKNMDESVTAMIDGSAYTV